MVSKEATMLDHRLSTICILVVENDQTIRELLKKVLLNLGFSNIHLAADGFEAIHILRAQPVDLVITDWELLPNPHVGYPAASSNKVIASEWGDFPPDNGASFVKCLRHSRLSPNPYVPVIMFTGPTLANNVRYARDAGVNEILIKPIIAEDLCKRIIEIVEKPRSFVTSETYKGPCRRRKYMPLNGTPDRRKAEIRVISYEEQKHMLSNG